MQNNNDSQTQFVDLIARAQAGDEDAFEQLYNQYFTALYRYVLIRVGSSSDADDIVQMVFLKFYKNLKNWQNQGYLPSAYLYSIARSVIADHFRTNARTAKKISNSEEILEILSDPSQSPQSSVIQQEETANLYAAIKRLPQNYQEVLLLRYIENLPSKEIAAIIDKSDVATRKLLSRAVATLSDTMHSREFNKETDL